MMKVKLDQGYSWVVLGCALLYNFIEAGVYEAAAVYMMDWMYIYGATWAQVGTITSLMNGIAYLAAICIGPLVDRFGCRIVAYMGTGLLVVGYITSAMVPSILWLYFTYGVLLGIGDAIFADAPLLSVHFYFSKKRPFAAGFCRVGHSLGEFIMYPVIRFLLDYYGLRGAMLLHAGLVMQCFILGSSFRPIDLKAIDTKLTQNQQESIDNKYDSNGKLIQEPDHSLLSSSQHSVDYKINRVKIHETAMYKNGHSNTHNSNGSIILETKYTKVTNNEYIKITQNEFIKSKTMIEECEENVGKNKSFCSKYCGFLTNLWDFSLFRDYCFVEYIMGMALCQYAIAVGTKFTPLKAMEDGMTSTEGTMLLTICAFTALVSRLISCVVANLPCINRTLMCGTAFLLQSIVIILNSFAWDFTSYAVFMICFGGCMGMHYTVSSTVLVDLVGVSRVAQASSFMYFFMGCAVLTALPIAGIIIDTTGNMDIPYYIFGTLNLVGSALILIIPIQQRYRQRKQ